jgi:hypothetical protein
MRYNKVREQIRNADVLLFRNTSLKSKIICWLLKKHYTHTAIAAWWNQRLMVIESVEKKGVRTLPLSEAIRKYHGDIDLYKPALSDKKRQEIVDDASSFLGLDYGLWAAIKLGIALLLKERRLNVEEVRETLICSEAVSKFFRRNGCDLCPEISDGNTHPDDISQSDKLVRIGSLTSA